MMQEIPNADVVITNPTHYAVALRYEAKEMEAPKVIAKGKDYVALKIREIAKEHGVVTWKTNRWRERCTNRPKSGNDPGGIVPGCGGSARLCVPDQKESLI